MVCYVFSEVCGPPMFIQHLMARRSSHILVLLLAFLLLISISEQLQSSQTQTLLRIQGLLNFPAVLRSWTNDTDFCNTEPSSTLTVVCYDETITQLHIIGKKGATPLPYNFSIDSFFTTIVKLPSLKVLELVSLGLWGSLPGKISRLSSLEILNLSSNFFQGAIPLEILSLVHLQSLVLDGNMFTGKFPDDIDSLSALSVLSVKNNSLEGPLPNSLGNLENLRVLAISNNNFSGKVPDFSRLENLQVLDLEENTLGPQFPVVGSRIVSLVLRKNKFTYGIPDKVRTYYDVHHLDISSNRFVGPFPTFLLALPSIVYLNISGNRFTGMLFEDLPCTAELHIVDLSNNLLTGKLPSCLLSDSNNRVLRYTSNCLESGDNSQNPVSFCRNQALAVGILPHNAKQKQASKVVLAFSILGGILGGIALAATTFLVIRKFFAKVASQKVSTRLIAENASTNYTSKLSSDARYINQAMKLGALGLPTYRIFSLEELEDATNNFNTSTFMGEGSCGQMYRGQLKDGSYVAITCLKMSRNDTTQNFIRYIELISKLRHHHLVSALGHCFECYLDDSSVSRIFLVFEHVPNGSLRSWISERCAIRRLTWEQRIAAAIGIAKGIQFLHTGIVPGLFSNNLKITDILLDQNLVAKISSYNLPLLVNNAEKDGSQSSHYRCKEPRAAASVQHQGKPDIYDFGVILLEVISGKQIHSTVEVDVLKYQLQASITADEAYRRSIVDPAVKLSCSDESLRTTIQICFRCLLKDPEDRPSVEDLLWNLQYAAQVQDALRGDSQSSDCSPVHLPLKSSRLQLTLQ